MYIKVSNNQVVYPYSVNQLKKDNPQISFPDTISQGILTYYSVFPVIPQPEPQTTYTQKTIEETPQLILGVWTQTWSVVNKSPEEVNAYIESLKDDIILKTQQRMDNFARTRNYDNMLSLCSYANSTNIKFNQEGSYGVQVRDATWEKLYEILEEVLEEIRPMPSGYEDIVDELPQLIWP